MNQTTRNGLSFSGVEDYSVVEVEEDRNEWGDIANSNLVLGLYGVICVLGITGNLLVAFVLIRVPSLRSNTSDFMVHLSLADFIVCVMVIPFKLVQTTGKYPPNPGFLGELRCRLYAGQFLFWVGTVVSVYSLVTVNLERFVAIVYPLKYKVVFTRRVKYYMIASCWIVGALSKVFLFLLYGEDEVVGCHFFGWPSSAVQAVVGLANFMMALFGPFVLMVLVQWKVISTLKRQVKMLKSHGKGGHTIMLIFIVQCLFENSILLLQNIFWSVTNFELPRANPAVLWLFPKAWSLANKNNYQSGKINHIKPMKK